jgi:DNA polymerase I-like protein with 3'-5' exonuclease and polymerase domains
MVAYEHLPSETRVWIYPSNRPLNSNELEQAREALADFARQWVSHNHQLNAHCDVWHNRFFVMMVDETRAGASGCSIDKSVHFLQALSAQLQLDLFDRMIFSYKEGDTIHSVSRDEFVQRFRQGDIHDDTTVFDPLVTTKAELEAAFEKPLKQSWHRRFV